MPSDRTVHRAAVAAAAGMGGIALFQVALAGGAPLGKAAWGGGAAELSTGKRVASGVAAGVWAAGALTVLGRAGAWRAPVSDRLLGRAAWAYTGLLGVGAVLNLASPSVHERRVWAPVALALAVLCVVVARAGSPAADGAPRT